MTENAANQKERAEVSARIIAGQLALVVDTLPVIVYAWKLGDDPCLVHLSSSVAVVLGYTPEQFVETPGFWAENIHPEDRDRVVGEMYKPPAGAFYTASYRFRSAAGDYRWFQDCRRPVDTDPDGNDLVVGMLFDVSEEKKIRLQAEQQLQQIIQAHRLASLGEVVAGVAHEINNPNSFITYNVPMLEETWQLVQPIITEYGRLNPDWRGAGLTLGELQQDMGEIIQSIKIGSDRINKVVSNLKDFARLEDDAIFASVQINDVVNKAMLIVGAQARKGVADITLDLERHLPEIQGHFNKLEQVVANLVVNAIRAMKTKERGWIGISTRYLEKHQAVMIEVADNGVGIRPEIISQIMEPFFTTARESGGTGLGLSVSLGLVQDHSGVIGVHTRPGSGARFQVFLPLVQGGERLKIQPTILCVDDEPTILRMLNSMFMQVKKMPIKTTSDPTMVMNYLVDHPEVDIVMSDVMMPGVSGWDLLQAIRERLPLVSVVLFSGDLRVLENTDAPYQPDAKLVKPLIKQELFRMIGSMPRMRVWGG